MKKVIGLLLLTATPALAVPQWQYQQLIVSVSQYQCWIESQKRSATCHMQGNLNDIKLQVIGPFDTELNCKAARELNRYPVVPVNSGGVTVEIQSVDNVCIQIDGPPKGPVGETVR